jgi:UDP-3-O-acyl N-acetylglucosamine deacetylase
MDLWVGVPVAEASKPQVKLGFAWGFAKPQPQASSDNNLGKPADASAGLPVPFKDERDVLISQGFRSQRTIRRMVEVAGVGFFTGVDVRVVFQPAEPHTGVVFVRKDVRGAPCIPARAENVFGTNRRTTLGRPPHQIELVEHVLAALAGLRIDNCRIEIDAAELPGLDGSARGFTEALRHAGTETQPADRMIWTVDEPITIEDGPAILTLYPLPEAELCVSYVLDYGLHSPLGLQRHTHRITPEQFLNGLDHCRTFVLEEEADALRRQGIGTRATYQDLLVFGPHGPINNTLRAANEPARHKVLDIVGDLALFGHDLHGHVAGCRSGHTHNVALVRRLQQELEAVRPQQRKAAA